MVHIDAGEGTNMKGTATFSLASFKSKKKIIKKDKEKVMGID